MNTLRAWIRFWSHCRRHRPHCQSKGSIGDQPVKNIIWERRNQSIHFEEGGYKANVIRCFQGLEKHFGSEFSLAAHPKDEHGSQNHPAS
jgi:hypothetical protein